ncbi:hypothetical protein LWI29_032283 [Acer saccharum]|uniref:Phytosulfokine n=1 Tax=Acer saccharum TaxID=4024 RepID=A0AA39S0R9_ACESA|nr:hypothetical protein LWI29_032283 [Acer saccharum]KAK1558650.1 hypothetical protein Q3G72_005073 [Acer saccharum]
MSSKVSALCIATLLLFFFTLSSAARPHPGSFSDVTPLNADQITEDVEAEKVEEKCEGVGEDECLMRRTLAAHVDYIYTQKTQP